MFRKCISGTAIHTFQNLLNSENYVIAVTPTRTLVTSYSTIRHFDAAVTNSGQQENDSSLTRAAITELTPRSHLRISLRQQRNPAHPGSLSLPRPQSRPIRTAHHFTIPGAVRSALQSTPVRKLTPLGVLEGSGLVRRAEVRRSRSPWTGYDGSRLRRYCTR